MSDNEQSRDQLQDVEKQARDKKEEEMFNNIIDTIKICSCPQEFLYRPRISAISHYLKGCRFNRDYEVKRMCRKKLKSFEWTPQDLMRAIGLETLRDPHLEYIKAQALSAGAQYVADRYYIEFKPKEVK
jgi:hypothetical protein